MMKKMVAMVMVLLVAVNLCSCAVLGNLGVHNEPVETPVDIIVQPAEENEPAQHEEGPEELPTPELEVEEPYISWADKQYGNAPSNIAGGGHVAISEQGQLFWSFIGDYMYGDGEKSEQVGIYARVGDGYEKISDDAAGDLNVWGDRLYYVDFVWDGFEGTSCIVSMNFDGSDRKALTEPQKVTWTLRTDDEEGMAEYTHHGGYTDLLIYDGELYFICDNGRPGGRDIHSAYMDMTYNTIWHNEKSLCRMDLAGENTQVIIESLGNGSAHYTIEDDKIWYSTSYDAGITIYPHITLNVCDLDGSSAQLLYGTTDTVSAEAKYEIISGLFAADGKLFVSAKDSEGDFPHGRMMVLTDGQYDKWGQETYYVNYVYDGAGGLYSLCSPTEYTLFDDVKGVEYVEEARIIRKNMANLAAEGEVLHDFGSLARWGDAFSGFEMSVFDNGRLLTLLTDDALYTMDLANGGELERVQP